MLTDIPYRDRRQAAQTLAARLESYAQRERVLVLGLPRGGVPVAYGIARRLGAPLDVMVVRKLGVPGREELAMGAIATGNVRVLNADVVGSIDIPVDTIDRVTQQEVDELRRRERAFRGDREPPHLRGRTVILVDDGLATGATMRAAVAAVRAQEPAEVVVAVPVAPPETVRLLRQEADAVVCPATPDPFFAIGAWYEDFAQTTDEEVRDLLEQAWSKEDGG